MVGLGNDVAWHPDGSLIAIALSNSQIKIFDRRAAKLIQLYNVHLEAVNSIAFHPSGNVLITGSDDGSTKVLDLLEGRPIYTLVGHDDAVTAVAFSNDGSDFATASRDKQVCSNHFAKNIKVTKYHRFLMSTLPFAFGLLSVRLCCGN